MSPNDVEGYIADLVIKGFLFQREGRFVEIAVVDQVKGPMAVCEWLQFLRHPHGYSCCWLSGNDPGGLAIPRGWVFEESLSSEYGFVDRGTAKERLIFLRHEGALDVFQDQETGKIVYMGRPLGTRSRSILKAQENVSAIPCSSEVIYNPWATTMMDVDELSSTRPGPTLRSPNQGEISQRPRDSGPVGVTLNSWEINSLIDNRFEIFKILKGGMGIVYIVYDYKDHVPYALKTFLDEVFALNPDIDRLFTKEALAWVNLESHQNIVTAHLVHHIDGKPYLSLEYVDRGDLDGLIRTGMFQRNLPLAINFGIQFCEGMSYALSKGIKAHRDIKPQNCLVTSDDILKITDFGLAKVFEHLQADNESLVNYDNEQISEPWFGKYRSHVNTLSDRSIQKTGRPIDHDLNLSRTGGVSGTCTHMAPEQFDDAKNVDVRADIYSFGVLLYQMITGRLPFEGSTWQEFEKKHKHQAPPLDVIDDPDLRRLIAQCLAKEPERRFADFGEVRGILATIYTKVTGEPAPKPVKGNDLKISDLGNKGTSLANLERYEEAIRCFDDVLQLNPTYETAWINKGLALIELKKSKEAMECFNQAIEIDPLSYKAWFGLGSLFETLNRLTDAMVHYDRAVEINPDHVAAWFGKANVFRQLGDHTDEISCYDRVIRTSPRHFRAWANKGVTLRILGRNTEAVSCLDIAIGINPRDKIAWFNRGEILMMSEVEADLREAIRSFDQVSLIDPTFEYAFLYKGVVLENIGEIEAAVSSYDSALDLNPLSVEAWFNRGNAHSHLGAREKALSCYEQVIELDPNHQQVWMNMGVLFGEAKKLKEALDCFVRAEKLGHPEATAAVDYCRRLLLPKTSYVSDLGKT